MIVLGLDTTGPDCSVSLVDEATVRGHFSRHIVRGHAEVLAGMVADIFEAAEQTPKDVDRIAVCTGPGSFTGLRVALSFAKGFALPRSLPIIGINALDVTAQDLWLSDKNERLVVYRDIRRGEVIHCEYEAGHPIMTPRSMSFEDSVKRSNRQGLTSAESISIDTRILAWLAIDRDPDEYPAEPLYSRGPDAKLPGGKSLSK